MIHIACSTDDNYAVLCGVMLCSLLENNKKNIIHIHILKNELNEINIQRFIRQCEKYKAICSFHTVNDKLLEKCKYRTKVHKLSKAAYYRILLSSLLPEVPIILYLDCDMIVRSDLSEIYKINMSGYGIAAVEDYGLPFNTEHLSQLEFKENNTYFNSGFLLINLDYWRKNNSENKLIEFSSRERIVYFHDQDALNYVFKDSWYRVSPTWNHLNIFHIRIKKMFYNKDEYDDFFNRPRVIHYSDKYFKPWFKTPFIPYKKEWSEYLKKSEWKDFIYKNNNRFLYTICKIIYLKFKLFIYKLKFKLLW